MDAEQLSALLAQIENLELTVRAAGPSPLAADYQPRRQARERGVLTGLCVYYTNTKTRRKLV